jgi:hypothetical protein
MKMTYIHKETLISSIINALFSIAFFSALFHNEPELILGGKSGLTMDFLPQTFFVGLFAALPSSLLTLKRLKMGALSPSGRKVPPLPNSLPVRILCLALGSFIFFGGGAVLILSLPSPMELSFASALVIKAAYSILITIIITPLAVGYLISTYRKDNE